MDKCNSNLEALLEMAHKLLELSNVGDMDRNDSSCGVLYGIARDSAYRIIEQAEQEITSHKESGKWK